MWGLFIGCQLGILNKVNLQPWQSFLAVTAGGWRSNTWEEHWCRTNRGGYQAGGWFSRASFAQIQTSSFMCPWCISYCHQTLSNLLRGWNLFRTVNLGNRVVQGQNNNNNMHIPQIFKEPHKHGILYSVKLAAIYTVHYCLLLVVRMNVDRI